MGKKPTMLVVWDFVKTLTFKAREFGQLRVLLFNILYKAVTRKELTADELDKLRFICQYLDYDSIRRMEKFLIENEVKITGRIW